MNRPIISFALGFAVALATVLAPVSTAFADDPAPTAAQMAQAKAAFGQGKKLHEQGKLPEAIEKFKLSYALSKNPLLLYNIGLTMDEAGMEDLALFYYRKFLAEAPADAAPRVTVLERTKVLEKKFNPNASSDPAPTKPADSGPRQPLVVKPAGTYSATDFQHETVEVAPPAKPLDITAFVPEDSGFTVTLFFRTAGEGKFTSKEMRWRYKELVGRVPAPKMIGDSIQYYIEVKDQAGAVVTRAGKSTSPNLVQLEAGAPQRYYPDFSEDGDAKTTVEDIKRRDDEDDPLNRNKKPPPDDDDTFTVQPQDPGPPGAGFSDVGSSKFTFAKWGSTALAGTMIALTVVGRLQVSSYAKQVEEDSASCGAPPCREFDGTVAGWEATGKRWATISNYALVAGIGTAAVAGYFWYKELTSKKRTEVNASTGAKSPETSSWVIVPSIGDGTTGFMGGTAATRF